MTRAKDKHQPPERTDKDAKPSEPRAHEHAQHGHQHRRDGGHETQPMPAGAQEPGPESTRKPSPEIPGASEKPQAQPDATADKAVAPSAPPDMEQLQDQLLRLRADFDNFRKRALRDKVQLYETANEDLMLELLPVLDHLQLGIQAAVEHHADSAFREGLQMIFDQLMGVLTKFGLDPFDAENQPFDPSRFEAVNYATSDTKPEGTIVAQIRRGYLLKNRLLRPAQVVVSSGAKRPSKDGPVKPVEPVKE